MAITLKHQRNLSARASSKLRRQIRGRKKISGTAERPRLVVTRSSKHITAQVVDDLVGKPLVSASTLEGDLRAFDKTFAAFEPNASDAELADLADTRTARAFMLFGRVTGTFD